MPKPPDLLRAEMLALERTAGAKISELATKYDMSPKGVRSAIDTAAREGFFARAEAHILNRLIAPALAVYEQRLLSGDLAAARDILFGVGVLGKAKPALPDNIETMEAYRILRRRTESIDATVLERHDDGAEFHGQGLQTPERGVRSDMPKRALIKGHREDPNRGYGESERPD